MDINFSKDEILRYAVNYEKHENMEEEFRLIAQFNLVASRGFLNLDDLARISYWKSPRASGHISKNHEFDVREISRVSFSTKSERLRIGSLRLLTGVSWPTASAILHFVFPETYPILDVRAMHAVGGSTSYNFDRWEQYTRLCQRKAKEHEVTLRQLDRALWTFDKENT